MNNGIGEMKVLCKGGIMILPLSKSVIQMNQSSELYSKTDIHHITDIVKHGNRTDYKIVVHNPEPETYDYFIDNNCSIASVTPHIDNPYRSEKYYMTAFFDDTFPWKTKLTIELEQIDMDSKSSGIFELLYSSPQLNEENVASNIKEALLFFSIDIFPESVSNENVKVFVSGQELTEYTVSINQENQSSISVKFLKTFEQYELVKISIGDNLKSITGESLTGNDEITFKIGKITPLIVTSVYPANQEANISPTDSAKISFNSNIDLSSINSLSIRLKAGISLKSLNFNTGSDYIEIPFNESLNVSSLTIFFAVKFSSLVDQYILSRNLDSDVVPYDLRIVNKKLRFSVLESSTWFFSDSNELEIDKLYYIAVSFNSGVVKIYINFSIQSDANIGVSLKQNSHSLWIGKFIGNIMSPHANFGRFTMWNTELTSQEIKLLKTGTISKPNNLVFMFLFSEQPGELVVDSGPLKNNGFLINGSEYSRGILSNSSSVPVYYSLDDLNIVKVTPLYYMASGETYTIHANSNVMDTSGNSLSEPLESSFIIKNIDFGSQCARYVAGANTVTGSIFTGRIIETSATIFLKVKLFQMSAGQKIFGHGTPFHISVDSQSSISAYLYGVKTCTVPCTQNAITYIVFVKNGIYNNLSTYNDSFEVIGSSSGSDTKSESWGVSGHFGINGSLNLAGLIGFVYIYGVAKNDYQIKSILSGSTDSFGLLRKFLHNETAGDILHDYSSNDIPASVKNATDEDFWGRTF